MTNGILIGLSALAGVWLGWYAVPICLPIIALLLLIDRDFRISLLMACLVFSCVGAWRSDQPAPPETSDLLATSSGAIGRVESFPRPSGDGHRVTFSVSEICVAVQCIPADETVLLYVAEQNPPIARGQRIRVEWEVTSLPELAPGYRGFVQTQNATAQTRTSNVIVLDAGPHLFTWIASSSKSIGSALTQHLPGDTGALATGIVIGDDSDLSDQVDEQFRATGTSHITAVSGQNVSIILGFLTMWWHPKHTWSRWLFHATLLAVIWMYALLVGLEPPALRAAIVASLAIISSHVGRRPDPMTSLVLTLGGMALWQPLVVHSVGFWLSATASAALCLALPKELDLESKWWWTKIAFGPIVASLATLPIVLATFGTWSPISIIANILISPVITLAFLVTYPFTLIALIFPPLAGILAFIPGIVLDFALVIVDWLAPIAGSIRVDSLGPVAMLVLWLPIACAIWLLSGESNRWIRRAIRNQPGGL